MKKKSWRIPIGFAAAALFLWRADPTPASFLGGAVLMALGEAVRFISAGTLIKFEGVTRTGIYAYTRNPLYIGSLVIGLGACLMGRDAVFATVVAILFPLVYLKVIRREEAFLVERYGDDYRSYLTEVPRIFPRRFSVRTVLANTAPFLAIKNREYRGIIGVALVWAAIAVKMALG